MTIREFIEQNGIQKADAIVLRKKVLGMVDHYAIFIGYRGGRAVFVANFTRGIKEISHEEMAAFLNKYQPTDIVYCPEENRPEAIRRAISRLGEKAYSYIRNNCEHFMNYVHHGFNYSGQVANVGKAIVVGSTIAMVAAVASKNQKAALWGLGFLVLGALVTNSASRD